MEEHLSSPYHGCTVKATHEAFDERLVEAAMVTGGKGRQDDNQLPGSRNEEKGARIKARGVERYLTPARITPYRPWKA
jgi:hypothetical protein